ncbi:GyrI-like domain-containing protein [Acetobacterium sp.]|uniref:AraC family transcriptional regulator n=1 Tax=Acetobacterium sp. TaxID=1872094 RepID=UPI0027182695|nr:GyrI-like domain-containing protein [Acetobacterium sp.]MDO9491021.1 GyrI-like domain-containing protein [Acetobacterium sp.]
MKMKIEMILESEIAYIRRMGSYGVGNIQTMEKLKTWATTRGLLNDESIILGLTWDNPATTKPEDCRYDVGLIVRADQQISDSVVQIGQVSPGEYAVFEIEHTAEAMQQAWSELFLELSKHGYQVDDSRPITERYAAVMVKNHQCEICVPIG